LGDVLNKLAAGYEGKEIGAYSAHIFDSIDPLDFDTHVDLAKQYQKAYKSILPKEIKLKKPEELAKNFQELIQNHTELVTSIREQIGVYKPKAKKYEAPKKEAA